MLKVLGSGGMGKVFKVRNVISDRVEAMKVLLPDLATAPELANRFLLENPLAFLLAAEVVAATAVVSEAALVYVARHRNLLISLATLALQAVLSVALILIAQSMGWPPIYYAAAVALALMLALGFAAP